MGQKFIPLSVPNLKGNEIQYVVHAIETEWVSSGGPYVNEFEEQIATYVKSKGSFLSKWNIGLHIALKVCGVTEEDEVIVPTLTFIAAVNPVKYIGAEPIFMDCDDSLCMDAHKLAEFCENECSYVDGKLINNRSKNISKLLLLYMFSGTWPIWKNHGRSDKIQFKVIEDATEALGTYYSKGKFKDKYAGTIGTVGVYSFNGNKIITTGGGGMIVSDDKNYLKELNILQHKLKVMNFIIFIMKLAITIMTNLKLL